MKLGFEQDCVELRGYFYAKIVTVLEGLHSPVPMDVGRSQAFGLAEIGQNICVK